MENLQNDLVEEKYEVLENINYEIYNALNLVCPDLGDAYKQTGFNPFESDFTLDESFIAEVITNQKNAEEVYTPEFLEQGEKAILNAFELAQENALEMIDALQNILSKGNVTPEMRARINRVISYLKMQIQLIITYKKQLKKQEELLKWYQNIIAVNWQLSEITRYGFMGKLNIPACCKQALEINFGATNPASDKDIIKQAQEIIANNQKNIEHINTNVLEDQIITQEQQKNTSSVEPLVNEQINLDENTLSNQQSIFDNQNNKTTQSIELQSKNITNLDDLYNLPEELKTEQSVNDLNEQNIDESLNKNQELSNAENSLQDLTNNELSDDEFFSMFDVDYSKNSDNQTNVENNKVSNLKDLQNNQQEEIYEQDDKNLNFASTKQNDEQNLGK